MNRFLCSACLALAAALPLTMSACSSATKSDPITAEQVPAPVMQTLDKEGSGGEVLSRSRKTVKDSSVYNFNVSMGGKIYDISIDEKGTFLGKQLVGQPTSDPRNEVGGTQIRRDLKNAGVRNER